MVCHQYNISLLFYNFNCNAPFYIQNNFFRDTPTDNDHEIFDAVDGKNIDPNKYPWLSRWMYSMRDYNNVNIL